MLRRLTLLFIIAVLIIAAFANATITPVIEPSDDRSGVTASHTVVVFIELQHNVGDKRKSLKI
jgi:hypothetical protein